MFANTFVDVGIVVRSSRSKHPTEAISGYRCSINDVSSIQLASDKRRLGGNAFDALR